MADSDYPNLRCYLNPNLADLPDQRLKTTLALRDMDAEAMEGFLDDLGKFALKAAPAVLPLAGQVVGTVFGGPAGGAIGSSLGSMAGGAISKATGGQGPSAAPHPGAPGVASSSPPAASQLLQTVLRPETLQALVSMAMGPTGKPNVSVGGTPVPVAAFSNLIGTLAGRAEAESRAAEAMARESVPAYLQDYAGEAKGDPAVAESRAEALFELLEASESGEAAEAGESAEYGEASGEWAEWEAEADARELLELAGETFESESESEDA